MRTQLTALALCLGTLPTSFGQAQTNQEKVEVHGMLKLGETQKRTLASGTVHVWNLSLDKNQYVAATVLQEGIDVVVTVLGPAGKKIFDFDGPNGAQGPEPAYFITEDAGTYHLEIKSSQKNATIGHYEVKIDDLREVESEDRDRVANLIAAVKTHNEALQLLDKGTAESLRMAIEGFERALQLWRKLGNRLREALALLNIGNSFYALGETTKEFEYYTQALPLFRAEGHHRGEASSLLNIGLAYANQGENRKALDYYNQALSLNRSLGDHSEEAITLNNIGMAYSRLNEPQKAIAYLRQSLPLRRAANDRRGEGITLNNIGIIYIGLGEMQNALQYYNQALSIRRETGDRRGEAITLSSIGRVYSRLGDTEKAIDYYHRALLLHQTVGNRQGESRTLGYLGNLYFSMGQGKKAMDYCTHALELARASGGRLDQAVELLDIGRIHHLLGHKQRALESCEQALLLSRAVGSRSGEAMTLFIIAKIERDFGNLPNARNSIEEAIGIIDSLRTKVANQELRSSFMASKHEFYEFHINLLMQLHHQYPNLSYDVLAFEASECTRARSFLELLSEAHVEISQGVDSTLNQRAYTLQQQLNAKERHRLQLLGRKHTEEQIAEVKSEISELLIQLHDVEAQIRTTNPHYAALAQPQPLTLNEIQQQVLDDETMLLEYALGEERSFLWAVTRTALESFELPRRAVIDSLGRRVYDLLTARNQHIKDESSGQRRTRVAQADAELPQAAIALSQILLKPVAEVLGTKRLLVVTEGILQYIPFGALEASTETNYRPLALDHEIIGLSSASVLSVLRRELAGRKLPEKTVAVLADPVFASDDPRIRNGMNQLSQKSDGNENSGDSIAVSLREMEFSATIRETNITEARLNIPRLVFSRVEANGIAALASNTKSLKALDFAANRGAAMSAELRDYRIVHFATHGLLNSAHPELSGIVLSLVDESGIPQDGFLRLHEIYNLKLPVDLVVLSACQTGLGKEVKGEGLIGLTRGFMYAGAARVVASLWKVDDEATAELMKRFYRKMLGAQRLRPAAALREAQISMWQEKRWQAPYYWAAFVLQGEYE